MNKRSGNRRLPHGGLWGIIVAACCGLLPGIQPAATAGSIFFGSDLAGFRQRPTPVDTPARGLGSGHLTGGPGRWVFNYHIEFDGLSGSPLAGHIHLAQDPVDADLSDQTGPAVLTLPPLTSPVEGAWRFDDPLQPLTDGLQRDLVRGTLYFDLHSTAFPDGELRGQIAPAVALVPLPPAVCTGLSGLALVGALLWRRAGRAAL